MNKPKLFFLVGLSGSGKSIFSKSITELVKPIEAFSSDKIIEELYGDESIQGKPQKVFNIFHKRIFSALKNGKNCIYDATNLKQKDRLHFLLQLKQQKIDCEKICYVMCVPFEICIERDSKRKRTVGKNVIMKQMKSFEMPCRNEGWDWIITHRDCYSDLYSIERYYQMEDQPHDTPFHKETIKQHFKLVEMRAIDKKEAIRLAARYHDLGKFFTKEFKNGVAHYYSHEKVSAYLWLTSKEFGDMTKKGAEERAIAFEVLYLIQCHMLPFFSGVKNEEKIKRYFPDSRKDLMELHYCDIAGKIED